MHLLRYNANQPPSDWIHNIKTNNQFKVPPRDRYVEAIQSNMDNKASVIKEKEYQRHRDGMGGLGTSSDVIVGSNLGDYSCGPLAKYFVQSPRRSSVASTPRSSTAEFFNRSVEEKNMVNHIPQDVYNPITQTYVAQVAEDSGNVNRRIIRTRPWSLYYPNRPYNRAKIGATTDHLNQLMHEPEEEVQLDESLKKHMNLNSSNDSEYLGKLLQGKNTPPDGSLGYKGRPRQRRDSYNRLLQMYHSSEDEDRAIVKHQTTLEAARNQANLKAIKYSTDYDILTQRDKLTGVAVSDIVSSPISGGSMRGYSDIFFNNSKAMDPRTRINEREYRKRIMSRHGSTRNPVLESTRLAPLPKKIRSRERDPMKDGDSNTNNSSTRSKNTFHSVPEAIRPLHFPWDDSPDPTEYIPNDGAIENLRMRRKKSTSTSSNNNNNNNNNINNSPSRNYILSELPSPLTTSTATKLSFSKPGYHNNNKEKPLKKIENLRVVPPHRNIHSGRRLKVAEPSKYICAGFHPNPPLYSQTASHRKRPSDKLEEVSSPRSLVTHRYNTGTKGSQHGLDCHRRGHSYKRAILPGLRII